MADNMIDVLTISTKGQIVLPNAMRKVLSLSEGDKMVAFCSNDAIVLKKLDMPKIDEFYKAIEENQEYADLIELKNGDIAKIIKEYRLKEK